MKISNHWKGCDLIIGDFNLKPNLTADLKLLETVCGTTHKMALNEMTTLYGQPDHIIMHKRFENRYFATSFKNFISDHKTVVIRIGSKENCYEDKF